MFLNKILLIALAGLSLSQPAWALRSDRGKPINIKADSVVLDEKKEISHYRGNVELEQGSLVIIADEIVVYLKKGKLDKIIINGKPARFEQQPENNLEIVKSIADHMEYFTSKEFLLLQSNAEVIQGGNHFKGDYIEYDTYNSVVRAKKDANSKSRVHAIIQPRQDNNEK